MSENSITYAAKPIGARKLTWFPLLTDPEDGPATYGEPVRLSRLIEITTTPIFAEGRLESDDGIEEEEAYVVGYDVNISASQLVDSVRAALLGHAMDDGGGMLTTDSDVAQEGALAWEEELSSKDPNQPKKFKKVVLYKGKFREFAETASTRVQGGITYQTHGLTGRFYRRNDGHLKYTIREDTPDADATKIADWFESPQEYTATASPPITPPTGD